MQRRQAIAVTHGIDIGRIRFESFPDDDADLPMRVGALAEEPYMRAHDEIARHLSPRELELVACGPHVGAAAESVYVCVTAS